MLGGRQIIDLTVAYSATFDVRQTNFTLRVDASNAFARELKDVYSCVSFMSPDGCCCVGILYSVLVFDATASLLDIEIHYSHTLGYEFGHHLAGRINASLPNWCCCS